MMLAGELKKIFDDNADITKRVVALDMFQKHSEPRVTVVDPIVSGLTYDEVVGFYRNKDGWVAPTEYAEGKYRWAGVHQNREGKYEQLSNTQYRELSRLIRKEELKVRDVSGTGEGLNPLEYSGYGSFSGDVGFEPYVDRSQIHKGIEKVYNIGQTVFE